MHRTRMGVLLAAVAALATLAVGGCTAAKHAPARAVRAGSNDAQLTQGLRAARAQRWAEAQTIFASLLRHDVRNARLQFLNGLAYEQLAQQGGQDLLDLARVGYRNAIDFARGNYWAHLHLGFLELERGEYAAAQEAFAGAVKDQPERWEALFGLGVASYYAGDLRAAGLAAGKVQVLAPNNAEAARLAAFVLAARGERELAEHAMRAYGELRPADRRFARRVREVMRYAALAQETSDASPLSSAASTSAAAPNQIMIDVTIVLSSLLNVENRGVNLFDGLTVQYGLTNTFTTNRTTGSPSVANRSITQTISVPTLNYNLNLFNDSGQFYQVLARPTLTAFVGRESEFFAGRTVNVTVSGVNLGALQPIDVGVGLKVTPESIDGRNVTFRVSASRSFLSREEIGSFNESLTTFKQLVSATAEVELGQTLLLSALSEAVQDSSTSRVPVLGSIPGPNLLFSQSSKKQRRESLLVLITPTLPALIETSSSGALRPSELESLLKFWKEVVEPQSSIEAITRRLSGSRFFKGAESGDLYWSGVRTSALIDEALAENVHLARR